MPKVNCCDVCYYERNSAPLKVGGQKLTESDYTISRKTPVKKISLSVCEEHKTYFKDCKTIDDCELKVKKLYSGG
jgi:hypothetical protein